MVAVTHILGLDQRPRLRRANTARSSQYAKREGRLNGCFRQRLLIVEAKLFALDDCACCEGELPYPDGLFECCEGFIRFYYHEAGREYVLLDFGFFDQNRGGLSRLNAPRFVFPGGRTGVPSQSRALVARVTALFGNLGPMFRAAAARLRQITSLPRRAVALVATPSPAPPYAVVRQILLMEVFLASGGRRPGRRLP